MGTVRTGAAKRTTKSSTLSLLAPEAESAIRTTGTATGSGLRLPERTLTPWAPRHPGWPRFQPLAGEYLGTALHGKEPPEAVVAGAVRHRLGDEHAV